MNSPRTSLKLSTGIGTEVASAFSNYIVFLKWAPGKRLIEENLCAEFGVSRSPVREAFHILEADGLVVRTARRGVRVTPMSQRDLAEVYKCRAVLEGLAASEAAKVADEAALERLQTLWAKMNSAMSSGKVLNFFNHNVAFTRGVHSASGNATLMRVVAGIDKQALRYRYFAHRRSHEMLELSLKGHGDVLEALIARKPALAQRRAIQVINYAHEVISRTLAKSGMSEALGEADAPADAYDE
jgi:DNA-binding GntR family transcriptional regulator